jgi:acetylornithine deacetylase/succinyl-diaminopimelate desuccinylase-like protein
VVCLLAATAWAGAAQRSGSSTLKSAVETFIASNQRMVVTELADLVSIPNVSSDTENIRRNASYLRGMLRDHGFKADVIETISNPLVYGELQVPNAKRTILFYAHYDGQPVEPQQAWKQASPFGAVLREGRMEDGAREVSSFKRLQKFDANWRLYGRSVADNKGAIIALLTALDALKASGTPLTANLRVIIDGEEESGSLGLSRSVSELRDRLKADLLIVLDDPVHSSGRPTVIFGAKGALSMEITTYGPKFGVHSGHYGNWVPNPGIRLARLLASMKDDDGRVLVKGFYDGTDTIHPDEQAMLDAVPDDAAQLMKLFSIAAPERPGLTLQQALQLPSLNIRGLTSAYTGLDTRTIIPDIATASLDIRLVKETPPREMAEKILGHFRSQGYFVTESDPSDPMRASHPRILKVVMRASSSAYRTSPLQPESRMVTSALERMHGAPPVQIRTSGATLPAAAILTEAIGFPAISVAIVNFDNNQHSDNENLRLGHLFTGIQSLAAVLTM